jgi:hypothetical protein
MPYLPKLLYAYNAYSFWLVENHNTGKLALRVDKGGQSQFPVKYANNRLGWDYPERLSKRAKNKALSLMKALNL